MGAALMQLRFDAYCANQAGARCLSTGLLPLAQGPVVECFEGDVTNALIGQGAHSYWAQTDDYLLLALWGNQADGTSLAALTQQLYSELLTQSQALGYGHLVRVWNYFDDINGEEAGLERYRQFCLGRYEAFAAAGIDERQFPSACALGHHGGDLLIYALASKPAPIHFENPRQAKAYEYPPEYGPRSPSFARASVLALANQPPKLFVSGTASVVGHVTQHPFQLEEQITVTLENLSLLLAHVEQQSANAQGAVPRLEPEVLKVYVRHPADLATIQARVEQAYPQVPVVYVEADICRADLLLEIDGIWNLLA